MLSRGRISRLRSCPKSIKIKRLFFKIKAKSMEVIVPIGVLDDNLHIRVDCLGGFDDKFTTCIGH